MIYLIVVCWNLRDRQFCLCKNQLWTLQTNKKVVGGLANIKHTLDEDELQQTGHYSDVQGLKQPKKRNHFSQSRAPQKHHFASLLGGPGGLGVVHSVVCLAAIANWTSKRQV